VLLLRAQLNTGERENALEQARALVADFPDSVSSQVVLATTLMVNNELDEALDIYLSLREEFPSEPGLEIQISGLLQRLGRPDEARANIVTALETNPEDPRLLWAQASYLEDDLEIDSAIEVYETLYEMDSNSIVAANNLASLLGTYRDDEESLERAWIIARRFRDADVPALQDTYGWIVHRRGDSEEAIEYLRPAAEGLSGDLIVQYHYAEALYALDRKEEALMQYRRAVELAGIADSRPQIDRAQARIVELEQALSADQ